MTQLLLLLIFANQTDEPNIQRKALVQTCVAGSTASNPIKSCTKRVQTLCTNGSSVCTDTTIRLKVKVNE